MVKRRGQSTLEYILLIAAITLVALYGIKSVVAVKTTAQMNTAGEILDATDTNLKTALGL